MVRIVLFALVRRCGLEEVCVNWDAFVVDAKAQAHAGATPEYASVWIGGAGSTTQAHYDVSNNVLAQLQGKKRVRLWGPSAHLPLRVFPDAHPRARKAQVRIPVPAIMAHTVT